MLESFLVLPGQVVIISDDDKPDVAGTGGGTSQKILWLNPKTLSPSQLEKWKSAADMALVFDEEHTSLKKLLEEGIVPVAFVKSPMVENYNPNAETGNCFTFDEYNPWSIFMALVRANETFRFPYDWQHIVRNMLKVR